MCFSIKSYKCQCLAFRSIHNFTVNNSDGDRIMPIWMSIYQTFCCTEVYMCSTCACNSIALVNWTDFVLVTHDDKALNVFSYIVYVKWSKGARPWHFVGIYSGAFSLSLLFCFSTPVDHQLLSITCISICVTILTQQAHIKITVSVLTSSTEQPTFSFTSFIRNKWTT